MHKAPRAAHIFWTGIVAVAGLRGAVACSSTSPEQPSNPGDAAPRVDGSTSPGPDAAPDSGTSGSHPDGGDGGTLPGEASAPDGGVFACVPPVQIHGNLDPLWSLSVGTGSLGGIAVTSNGLIVGGSASGALHVGSTVIRPADSGPGNSPFVLKLDSEGNLVWHRAYPGSGTLDAIGVDASGNVYVAGSIGQYGQPLDLGTGVLSGSLFLAKLDAGGATAWSKAFQPFNSGTVSVSARISLGVDANGDIAVMSLGVQPAAFGGPVVDAGTDQGFIASFDATGSYRYSKVFDGFCRGACAQFDLAGNLFVGGSFGASLDLGTPLTSPTPGAAVTSYLTTAFAAKLSPTGQVLWRLADGTDSATSAVTASGSTTFIAGTFSGTSGVATARSARGPSDLFLSALDESGAPVFETTVAAGSASIDALAADPTGGVVALGQMQDAVDFGGGVLTSPGYLLAKLDAAGAHVFSARFAIDPYTGLSGSGAGSSVAVDAAGNVFAAGGFYGPAIDLGTGLVPGSTGQFDSTLFVAKYAQGPAPSVLARPACPIEIDGGLPDAGRLVTPVIPGSVVDVALDPTTVYWATGTEVMSAPVSGGNPTVLAFAQKSTMGLAIDSRALYWANAGGPYHDGTIVSMPLGGGPAVTLVGSQDAPRAIAVDDVGVYWTAGGSVTSDGGLSAGAVLSAPFDGGAPAVLATGLGQPGPLAVGNGVVVYAASAASGGWLLSKVPRSGGSPAMLATTDRTVASIALDDSTAYWADADTSGIDTTTDNGRVQSVPLSGGASSVLAASQRGPTKVVLLGTSLFWSTHGSWGNGGPAGNAGIWTLPAAGGTPSTLLANLLGVSTFAIDAAHIAWADDLTPFTGLSGLFVTTR